MKKLGSTQRAVLENVAARRAPYEGHKSSSDYSRRMEVARQLAARGLIEVLPHNHPSVLRVATSPEWPTLSPSERSRAALAAMYRLTPAGEAVLRDETSKIIAHSRKKSGRQLDREIAEALAEKPVTAETITDAQIRDLFARGIINDRLRDLAITGQIDFGPHKLYGRGPAVGGALDRLAARDYVAGIFNRASKGMPRQERKP